MTADNDFNNLMQSKKPLIANRGSSHGLRKAHPNDQNNYNRNNVGSSQSNKRTAKNPLVISDNHSRKNQMMQQNHLNQRKELPGANLKKKYAEIPSRISGGKP